MKYSRVISHVNVELVPDVSETVWLHRWFDVMSVVFACRIYVQTKLLVAPAYRRGLDTTDHLEFRPS
jgi:hypothetical protein